MSWRTLHPRSRPAATRSSRAPQLWPRRLPRGPCPTQGPSCSSRERELSRIGCPGPKAREFAIETEKQKQKKPKKRNQDSPTPRVGRGDGTSCSPTDEPSFPTLCRDAPEPRSSLLACQPRAPGYQRKRRAARQERWLAAAPLRLGRHVRASQSRLQVGIHHGLAVWRLYVVGGFLELQQHGHLQGEERGTKPEEDDSSRMPWGTQGHLALPYKPAMLRSSLEGKVKPRDAAKSLPVSRIWPWAQLRCSG